MTTAAQSFDPADLDGHTIDDLSDYLDAGRTPRNDSIENSPGCQLALDALERLRAGAWDLLETDAQGVDNQNRGWISAVLRNISVEARAGRDIPLSHPDPAVHLRLTEGAVRGLIRAAGDGPGGALVGRVSLGGDVTIADEPITVDITATARYGENLASVAEVMRERIAHQLVEHTELAVTSVNVTITDIYRPRTAPPTDTSSPEPQQKDAQ